MKKYINSASKTQKREDQVRRVLESIKGKDEWVLACFVLNNSALFNNSYCFAQVYDVYENCYGVECDCHIIPIYCDRYDSVEDLKDFMYDYDFLNEYEYISHIYLDNPPIILSSEELIKSYESGCKYLGNIWNN
jgi:hypothetical protein